MDDFFWVTSLEKVLEFRKLFTCMDVETIDLEDSFERVLAMDIRADEDLPEFCRSTMDGYAVKASSTFGASMGSPAWLVVRGSIAMGQKACFSIGQGEAARIATGGMLPEGADSVVMIEFTEIIDENTIEVCKSAAPGQNVIEKGEDFTKGEIVIEKGTVIRPQEAGLMAALGRTSVSVYKKPVIGIISTGDEIVPVSQKPEDGKIRDINSHTLKGQVLEAGGAPRVYGIVRDDEDQLFSMCSNALSESDMLLISGGSSVGARDFTLSVLDRLSDSEILFHGISISPGKPTLLARVSGKAVWGLPGHVASAMVVFEVVVKPFIQQMTGEKKKIMNPIMVPAVLTRNVPSSQGREDFIRVRLRMEGNVVMAEPLLGKSGLISTMVNADGIFSIPLNTEGIDKGSCVQVRVF